MNAESVHNLKTCSEDLKIPGYGQEESKSKNITDEPTLIFDFGILPLEHKVREECQE